MGELGRLPLFLEFFKSVLRYIVHLDEVKYDRPLLNAAILEDEHLCVSKSWRKRVDRIISLFQCKISETLDGKYINEIYEKMKLSYLVHWRKMLGDESSQEGKLYLYRRIKSHFGMEPYLGDIAKLKFRRAVTAFRLSAHNLEIETGRYVTNAVGHRCSIRREDRFCCFCFGEFKDRVLGDEAHAVLKCPRFSDVRESFMSKFVRLVPNMKYLSDPDRLIYMLSCEGESARLVSRFLLVVLSAQRSSFIKLWREFNNPGGDMH